MSDIIRLCCFADEISPSIPEQIRVMKKHGISLCEVRSANGKNVSQWNEAETAEIAKAFCENKIGVWSVGSPLGKSEIGEDFGEYKARCEKLIRTAKILDSKRIRIFSFFNSYANSDEVIRRLNWAVDLAKENGIFLCHENEKEIFGDTLERVNILRENVPGMRIIFDPANFVQVGEDIEECLDSLSDVVDYYHIKDVIRESGEIVPCGFGDGMISEIVKRCRNEKVLTLEPHLTLFEGYSSIDKTEMKNKFVFSSAEDAFDTAVKCLGDILTKEGYTKKKGENVIWTR